jgi:hypothetical protein
MTPDFVITFAIGIVISLQLENRRLLVRVLRELSNMQDRRRHTERLAQGGRTEHD